MNDGGLVTQRQSTTGARNPFHPRPDLISEAEKVQEPLLLAT